MAIPEDRLSTTVQATDFLSPDSNAPSYVIDYELGGIALNDPSEGLDYQTWVAEIVGTTITLRADSVAETVVYSGSGSSDITEVSLAFDQNMRLHLAYIDNGITYFTWYDPNIPGAVTTNYGADVKHPRLCLDDKRPFAISSSDIILTYIKNGNLYFRQQRDRYETEYLLASSVDPDLYKVGMGTNNRLHWQFQAVAEVPDTTREDAAFITLDVSTDTRTYDITQPWRSMGKQGEYQKRVIWRRLGQHRSFTPRFTISAPIKRVIFDATIKITPSD